MGGISYLRSSMNTERDNIFRFDFDPNYEDFVGRYASKNFKIDYSAIRNFGKKRPIQDINYKVIIENGSILSGAAKTYMSANGAANRLVPNQKLAEIINYAEGIKIQRVVGGRIVEALNINEEDYMNEIKQEEKLSINRNLENRNNIEVRLQKNEFQLQEQTIAEIKNRIRSQKDSTDMRRFSSLFRSKRIVYIIIAAHVLFFLAMLSVDLYYMIDLTAEISLRKDYGQCLSYAMFAAFELNSLSGNLMNLISWYRGTSTTYFEEEEFFSNVKDNMLESIKRLDRIDLGMQNSISITGDPTIRWMYYEKRATEMIYKNGDPKNMTLREGLKQLQASLIDLASRDLRVLNESDSQLWFAYMNGNGKVQHEFFILKDTDFWNDILNVRFNEGDKTNIKMTILSLVGVIFGLGLTALTYMYSKSLDRVMDILYSFDRGECYNMTRKCDYYITHSIIDSNDNSSQLGIDTDSEEEYRGNTREDNQELEEIILVKKRKKQDSLMKQLIWLYFPAIFAIAILLILSLTLLKISTAATERMSEIDRLKESGFIAINLKKFLKTMTQRAVMDYKQKTWDRTIPAIKRGVGVLKKNSGKGDAFTELYISDYDSQDELKLYYDEIFTNDLCLTLKNILKVELITTKARTCEDLYGGALQKGFFVALAHHTELVIFYLNKANAIITNPLNKAFKSCNLDPEALPDKNIRAGLICMTKERDYRDMDLVDDRILKYIIESLVNFVQLNYDQKIGEILLFIERWVMMQYLSTFIILVLGWNSVLHLYEKKFKRAEDFIGGLPKYILLENREFLLIASEICQINKSAI